MRDGEPSMTAKTQGNRLGANLAVNTEALRERLSDCSDVVYRTVRIDERTRGLVVFLSNMVDMEAVRTDIIGKLQDLDPPVGRTEPILWHIPVPSVAAHVKLDDAVSAVMNAEVLLLLDGQAEAYSFGLAQGKRRGVQEPSSETVVRGPREGFTEDIGVNLSLLRHKLKTDKLKTIEYVIGRDSKTKVVLSYLANIASPAMIDEARQRLDSIDIDAVLETGYIEELIEDDPYSPFPQFQYTERPDNAVAQLLEGRFVLLVDGTPFVLIAPVTAWQFLQASEDYYERYMVGNLLRWLRLLFLFVALFLPGTYVAVLTYHHDMLPTSLVLSIAASRESIPFPALVEALIMEISFEALREAGIRLPKAVGQAVSILGALVIGQSAVQAGIVSAPMVIVVSLTGIASFCLPRFNFAITVRLLRFPIMILAGFFGLFGMVAGAVLLAAHLSRLSSFGQPYLSGVAPYHKGDNEDIFVRAPWWKLSTRPRRLGRGNRKRMGDKTESKRNYNQMPEW